MLTVDMVRSALGLDPADTADDDWLTDCVDAANVYVAGLPIVVDSPDPAVWSDSVTLGANLYAQHLYRNRGAPMGGVSLFDTAGGFAAAYPPPAAMVLLGLRQWAKPGIAGPSA